MHAPGLAQWIDDRSGIHPELNHEAEKYLEVTVLGGHRGNNRTKSQGQASHHQDKDREQNGKTGEMGIASRICNGVNQIDQEEKTELDCKAE